MALMAFPSVNGRSCVFWCFLAEEITKQRHGGSLRDRHAEKKKQWI